MPSLNHHHLHLLRHFQPRNRLPLPTISSSQFYSYSFHLLKLNGSNVKNRGCRLLRKTRIFQITAFGEDSMLDDWGGDNEGVSSGYVLSSSDGEDSDGDYILNPVSDIDLPSSSGATVSNNDSLTVTAHRLAMIARGRKKHRIKLGIFINFALISSLTVILLFVDWCSWKIVRLPLASFYLSRPFFISSALASFAGYLCVPVLRDLKIHQITGKEGPPRHSKKRATPTMGGIFFVPVGVGVAQFIAGFNCHEVTGAALATLAFAAIGLLDDILTLIKNHSSGLSPWIKLFLEAAVGISFSVWLNSTSISSPYSMKLLIPLPSPLGLVCIGQYYLLLTIFCFLSMGNGVNLTDGLDGLAGGTAALAFIGMSIAVLPICSELAIFGASMAGACIGFLLHNRYKASIFMGDTGSLALGAALAAMAACTGMFFPLFVSSGIFLMEALSVILQVLYCKTTEHLEGARQRLFQMSPFHHHLELCGFKEPNIVAVAYVISCILSLYAGYLGLISA